MEGKWWGVLSCVLVVSLSACSGDGDDGDEPVCGNNILEEGEACDDQQFDGKTCTDLGHTGGTLACSETCTFDESGCTDTACNNGTREGDEDCDGDDLGDQTCAGLGYDGGELACTDACTFDESGCYDCGGTDPCADITCSDHGTCRVTEDCQAYCECDQGYVPAQGYECVETGSCKVMGQECATAIQCCSRFCLRGTGETGYCSYSGCTHDGFCENQSGDGREMCCLPYEDDMVCAKVAEGYSCGDRSGGCGDPCVGEWRSACQEDHLCGARFIDDPDAVCLASCTSDADCAGCALESDPAAEFICYELDSGDYCMRRGEDCMSSVDCDSPYVCTVALDHPDEDYRHGCMNNGGKAAGEPCAPTVRAESYYDSCEGFCEGSTSRCSEFCVSDEDCPDSMLCYGSPFCSNSSCQDILVWSSCLWAEGSRTPCGSSADCPDGEFCKYFETEEGDVTKMCVTENCDPEGDDCSGPGEDCGEGLPPCWGNYCFGSSDGSTQVCSAMCEISGECPSGMACVTLPLYSGGTTGTCWPVPGSADPCTSDADCAGDETCQYWSTYVGIESLCGIPGIGGGEVGDSCQNNNECASNLCFGFGCTAICEVDSDCPAGYLCGGFNFQGIEETNRACIPFEGSGQECGSDADCPAGEACTYFQRDTGAESICMIANDPAAQSGEECGTGLPVCYNNQCFSNQSFSWCAAVCHVDTDCPEGFLCSQFRYTQGGERYPICGPADGSGQPCTLDTDCPAGEACMLWGRYDQVDWLCQTANDPGGQVGDECGTGFDPCYNNLCLGSGVDNYCSVPCTSDADCPVGTMLCSDVVIGGYEDDKEPMCLRFIGSADPCTSDADCTVAGEICGFTRPIGLPVEGRCREEIEDGGEPGDACESDLDCRHWACLDGTVCTPYCATNADCVAYGMECTYQVWDSGFDMTACTPLGVDSPFCSFCILDADCPGDDAKCIASAANPGEMYCGKPCVDDTGCPEGASCVDVGDGTLNCKPDSDTCLP